jgi:CBS domain-containing protein
LSKRLAELTGVDSPRRGGLVVEAGRVVGVISIGDVVKDSIRQMGQQIGFLETYIKGHSADLS